jgi:hypothetical protein
MGRQGVVILVFLEGSARQRSKDSPRLCFKPPRCFLKEKMSLLGIPPRLPCGFQKPQTKASSVGNSTLL